MQTIQNWLRSSTLASLLFVIDAACKVETTPTSSRGGRSFAVCLVFVKNNNKPHITLKKNVRCERKGYRLFSCSLLKNLTWCIATGIDNKVRVNTLVQHYTSSSQSNCIWLSPRIRNGKNTPKTLNSAACGVLNTTNSKFLWLESAQQPLLDTDCTISPVFLS